MSASSLDEWFLDPLFSAAEDVQESADRLESNFRTWQQESSQQGPEDIRSQRLRLKSGCDTLRWQLEVFERACQTDNSTSRGNPSFQRNDRKRRQDFVDIIRQQLQGIEAHVSSQTATQPSVGAAPITASSPCLGQRWQVEAGAAQIEVPLKLPAAMLSAAGRCLRGSSSGGSSLSGFLSTSTSSENGTPPGGPECTDGHAARHSELESCLSPVSQLGLSGFLVGSGESPTQSGSVQMKQAACSEDMGSVGGAVVETSSQLSDGSPTGGTVTGTQGVFSQAVPADGKTFPSLAGGCAPGLGQLHGWQCILFWVYHLQRATRRRQLDAPRLEVKEEAEGLLCCGRLWTDEKGSAPGRDGSTNNSRCDAPLTMPISRTTSSIGVTSQEAPGQRRQSEWHVDMPSSGAPVAVEDEGTRSLVPAWHLTARPRRMSTLPRPVSPSSRLILVCACAVMMLVVACYYRATRDQDVERPFVSLLEASERHASSPAFP